MGTIAGTRQLLKLRVSVALVQFIQTQLTEYQPCREVCQTAHPDPRGRPLSPSTPAPFPLGQRILTFPPSCFPLCRPRFQYFGIVHLLDWIDLETIYPAYWKTFKYFLCFCLCSAWDNQAYHRIHNSPSRKSGHFTKLQLFWNIENSPNFPIIQVLPPRAL